MQLFAISDLHLGHPVNRRALLELREHPDDWLVLAGDVGETLEQLEFALRVLEERFARVLWVPGNHDLWTVARRERGLRGLEKYRQLVELCRSHGVATPEDPYPVWPGEGEPCSIALMFLLYDYSFRPEGVERDSAVAWAAESGVVCADEFLLHTSPYASVEEWCEARCARTEARLRVAAEARPTVLVNHFPLRHDLVRLRRIPRFRIWCGTTRTEEWHRRYDARVVVTGHLHVRSTDWIDGVRFEEVSLGNPGQWDPAAGIEPYLTRVLPAWTSGPGAAGALQCAAEASPAVRAR